MKKRNVLLATDLSANSAFAAKWAHNYAQMAGVGVIVAHIIEINLPNWLRDEYSVLEDDTKRSKARERVAAWYREHTGSEPTDIVMETGATYTRLVDISQRIDASMLVIAKSGKSNLTKFLAGSTAQALAANPPCVVVTVHPDHTSLDEQTTIAVATDLITSERALEVGAVLASMTGSELDIIHAVTLDASAAIDTEDLGASFVQDRIEARANEQLNQVIDSHTDDLSGLSTTTHVLNARPVHAVLDFVDAHGTDVVVVGNASEYNVISNAFGRVSVKLMQTLPSTVIVVPPQAKLVD
ncbi:MAG: universal stress protein [Myxococcota bacterium]